MAFCKQCGTDLNNAAFCPNCGTAAGDLAAQPQAAAPVYADVRQRSMADMENMLKYFGAKQSVYDEYDAVTAQVEDLSSRGMTGWIVGAVICGIIGLFGVYFFFALAVACIVIGILLNKKNKEKLAVAVARQEELNKELTTYFKDYGYCPVGFEYTWPSTLAVLYDLISKGRVSTPGDAINIYLDDLHKMKMEEEAEKTREATQQAAKSAKKAAGYASASFWFK